MKKLEFCHALHKYVSYGASIKTLQYEDFLNWLVSSRAHRKIYPFLWAFLVELEFIEEKGERATVIPHTDNDVTDEGKGNPNKPKYVMSTEKLQLIRQANAERRKPLPTPQQQTG